MLAMCKCMEFEVNAKRWTVKELFVLLVNYAVFMHIMANKNHLS